MTETVKQCWWNNTDPEDGVSHPVRVRYTGQFGYPHYDADGRTMYENTHFLDEELAWENLIANAQARVSLAASSYRQARARLVACTEELASASSFADEVTKNHQGSRKS